MSTSETVRTPSGVPVLHVCTPDGRVFRFARTFCVGREHDCELRLQDAKVSRRHIEVSFVDGRWRVRDLKSANGLFVDGERVEGAAIDDALTVSLGLDGPSLLFELNPQSQPRRTPPGPSAATRRDTGGGGESVESYEQRYFGPGAPQGQIGGRTRMIRQAFEKVQKRQQRRLTWVIGAAAVAVLLAGGYAIYKHVQVRKQQQAALIFFYEMKAIDVAIARIENAVADSVDPQVAEQIRGQRERRRQMEDAYDNYLRVLNLYDRQLSEEDRLILHITRLFGECELAAPDDYVKTVKEYIRRWKSTARFANAIKTATTMGYTSPIAAQLIKHNLPPQYFYLALQESDFDALASGPITRYGYAKGMWQFIPETGARYGLTIGPLAGQPKPDLRDDRHNWEKATVAAARYIKDIYATDAQASGLLVIASYNWGEHRVIDLVKRMPDNPTERNFWKLIERHRIPPETYNYVFSIVSAAVIGENPRLFGFPFDNPLGFVEKQ